MIKYKDILDGEKIAPEEVDPDIGIDKPNKTIKKKVGCGSIYCTFIEYNNGNFYKLLIYGDVEKSTPCGMSWLNGVARLLTFSLRRAFAEKGDSMEKGILRQMRGHKCNRISIGLEFSCISAIAGCIDTYLKQK